jgi:trehalose-6-phosphate synthase
MRGVLRYNPFSWTGFEEQMDMAMSLSKEDKENNMNLAYNYIKRGSMTKWTEDFLKDL